MSFKLLVDGKVLFIIPGGDMKIKTKGRCAKCNEMYGAAQVGAHLLKCALQSNTPSKSMTEGYFIRISCTEQPGMYWIFATIPKMLL
jgi:hypothetical protein